MKRSFYLLLLFFVTFSACAQNQTTEDEQVAPTCENPVGQWVNEQGSTLVISTLDSTAGLIEGYYVSPSGAGSTQYPLIGWVNDSSVSSTDPCASCKENNMKVISFTVRWGEIGSITSWTGTCSVVDGTPTIKTLWNLARPNTQFDWDHILSGADVFTPN